MTSTLSSAVDPAPKRRTARGPTDEATAYARDVVAGKIVAGRLVIAACKRHLTDLEQAHRRGWRFDVERAAFAIGFFRFLKHSKGKWARQEFRLSGWQAFCVGCAYGWISIKTEKRRFRTIFVVVAKKNGKSVMLAGVGNLGLVGDGEEGAEIYSTATARHQAKIIFDEAKLMVQRSPVLAERVRVFARNLSVDATASKFEPISSDAGTGDGLNPHYVLVDELHRHKTRAMLDLMDSGMGAREQPMLWIITTAGNDDPISPYNTEFDYAEKVALGVVRDDTYFCYLATLDKDDRWDDPKVWIKANPGIGVTVPMEDLKRQAHKAKLNPALQGTFKRLRLNIRVSDSQKPIDLEQWRKCTTGKPIDEAALVGEDCYGGLDMASKIDIAAFLRLFPPKPDSVDKRFKLVARFWLPEARLEMLASRDAAHYQTWLKGGWIETTPGNIIDHSVIRDAIVECHAATPIKSLAYDPWNATQIALELADKDIDTIEFVQGIKSYTAPTKEFLAWVVDARIDHGGNPVLEWMATNLKVQTDKNENQMPIKQKSTGKIDGITSSIMAVGRWMALGAETSLYEDSEFFM